MSEASSCLQELYNWKKKVKLSYGIVQPREAWHEYPKAQLRIWLRHPSQLSRELAEAVLACFCKYQVLLLSIVDVEHGTWQSIGRPDEVRDFERSDRQLLTTGHLSWN